MTGEGGLLMRRGCLFGCGGVLLLCVIAVGLGYFVGLPRVQDRVADDFQEGISTVVADGINQGAGTGQFVITEEQLNAKLSEDVEDSDVTSEITKDGISINLQTDNAGRDVGYSAFPEVVDGKLELTNVEAEGFMEHFMPKDKLADAIEDGINETLAADSLVLTDITLGEGEMTLQAAPAS
jgi:hypothetical protein